MELLDDLQSDLVESLHRDARPSCLANLGVDGSDTATRHLHAVELVPALDGDQAPTFRSAVSSLESRVASPQQPARSSGSRLTADG